MTRRTPVLALVVVVIAVALPRTLPAQRADELAANGIEAYRAVRYDQAATLLRRAVDGNLSDSVRAVVFGVLAAIEFQRGRGQAGADAVRDALAADPGYRPDPLAFPPDVTEAFEAVRRSTRFVRVRAPADTTIQPGGRGYPVRLVVSAPHRLTAVLTRDGEVVRTLYEGIVTDSMDVVWPALGRESRTPPEGRFLLEIRSPQPTAGSRVVRLPLDARPLRSDTLVPPPPPADSLFLPERAAPRARVPGIALGLVAGVATFAMPGVVARDGVATQTRYVLGAAIGVATIAAVVSGSRGESLPANAATNRAMMDNWRREVDAVKSENRRRRGAAALQIVAGRISGGETDR
jgi:hypothetical protein